MPQDMKVWRRKARLKLIAQLGGRCVGIRPEGHQCDVTDPDKLEIEHKTPLTPEQSDHREKVGANKRIIMYRKEAEEGLVQLMCRSCNMRKVQTDKFKTEDEETNFTP